MSALLLVLSLLLPDAQARPRKARAPVPAPAPVAASADITVATPAGPPAAKVAPIPAVERISASIVVQVDDRDVAQQKAIAAAEAAGGWFSSLGADSVTLRVPTARLAALVEQVRGLGFVVDRTLNREALGAQLADARAAVAARREVLARYYEVLGTTTADTVVAVESEIDRVIREIESYEGRIRMLEDRAAFAQLDVAFRFRDRSAPAPTGRSSFAWVNAVDLGLLLADFRAGRAAGAAKGARPVAPEGFAPFRLKRGFAAVSPDDVVFRVRVTKNKPRADLAYWTEALRTRLVEAGYRLTGEGEMPSAGAAGRYLELVAPDGERDARWLVALYVDGSRITVIEAAGEAARFAARREAIVKAIGATAP
jgi:hypothetical protein